MVKKKAISPVVATALLLVIAVVAVIGFQKWYNTYQSGLNVKIEEQSNIQDLITIERLEVASDQATVYIKNGASAAIGLNGGIEVKDSAGTRCTNASVTSIAIDVNAYGINVSDCTLTDGAVASVTVFAESGVFEESEIIR